VRVGGEIVVFLLTVGIFDVNGCLRANRLVRRGISAACGGRIRIGWIVVRPAENRKLVYVREVDPNQAGLVIRTRIYDVDTNRFLREENP